MKRNVITLALILLAALAANMYAERPKESPDKTTFVVTGTVKKVFERNAGSYFEYMVQIRIEEVKKGENLKPKQYIYAYSFRRKPDAPLEPSASCHIKPPKEGQRIRAHIKHNRGTMEGIYPNWFEVLKEEKK